MPPHTHMTVKLFLHFYLLVNIKLSIPCQPSNFKCYIERSIKWKSDRFSFKKIHYQTTISKCLLLVRLSKVLFVGQTHTQILEL